MKTTIFFTAFLTASLFLAHHSYASDTVSLHCASGTVELNVLANTATAVFSLSTNDRGVQNQIEINPTTASEMGGIGRQMSSY